MPPVSLASTLLPLLVAFGVAGLLRYWGSRKYGAGLAELAPALGFLAGAAGLCGGNPFGGMAAHHEIAEIAAAAALGGLVACGFGAKRRVMLALAVIGALGAIGWPLGLWQPARLTAHDLLLAGAALVLAVLILLRLVELGRSGATPIMLVLIATISLGSIAALARQSALASLCLALAASSAGLLVWTWPFDRWRFGPAALLGGGTVFLALALAAAQGGLRAPWPLAVLSLVFWAERFVAGLPWLTRLARKKKRRPIALALGGLIPAAAAVGLACLLA